MNTVTQHDYAALGLPRDEEGPVFDKPWQAKAFSLIVHLHRAGLFPWAEWVQTFSKEINAAPAQPGESANDAYFVVCALMPTVNEVSDHFPADLLWRFRISSFGTHLVLWGVIGVAFGALAERTPTTREHRPAFRRG
ncbi:nitrile hydratase accessory protein [Klebsiella michiganensis]|uniref:nitrile hydratase accessory protein n=1 Tax=Klebsiella michiganensis TaxID=1134687 RepID=UPI000C79713B|nr:nitrile hydratase accessory protein [Klebsiella michiganensis]PLN98868.1 nitrile hydratase accessory protein [Klebsiella michiganensis]PLP21454.1 nitrile hydratase accessory protein [Klebsiella michiganensis]